MRRIQSDEIRGIQRGKYPAKSHDDCFTTAAVYFGRFNTEFVRARDVRKTEAEIQIKNRRFVQDEQIVGLLRDI